MAFLIALAALEAGLVVALVWFLLFGLYKDAGGSVRAAWHSVAAYLVLRRALFGLKLRWDYCYHSGGITFTKRPGWKPLRYKYARILTGSAEAWQIGDLYKAQLMYIGLWPIVYRVNCRVTVRPDMADFVALDSFDSPDFSQARALSPLEVRLLASEYKTARLTRPAHWKYGNRPD